MREERQVFYLPAVKLGRKKASVLQVRVYFQSHVSLRLGDLTRNCTSAKTTGTRHALCLKYISGLNLKTGQRIVFYLVNSQAFFFLFFVRNKIFKKC